MPTLRNIAVVFLVTLGGLSQAESVELTPITVELTRKGLFEIVGTINIDSLEVGKGSTVRVVLRNRTGQDIPLGEPSATCGCISVTCDATELRNETSCNLILTLNPDRNYSEGIWYQSISLDSKADGVRKSSYVSIRIQAGLAGVFTVAPRQLLFIAPDDDSAELEDTEIVEKIKLRYTPPVTLENLRIEGSDFLNMADLTIEQDKDDPIGGSLTVKIASKDIPKDGAHGSVVLTDTKSGQSRIVALSMIRRPSIRVVPSTLMVQRVEDEGGSFAYGMVVRDGKEQLQGEATKTPVMNASVNGMAMPVEVLSGGQRLQRFRIALDKDFVDKISVDGEELDAQLHVVWGLQKVSCKTVLKFPSR